MPYTFTTKPVVSIPEQPRVSSAFYNRLLEFYSKQPRYESNSTHIWKEMHRLILFPLHNALEARNATALEDVLSNLYRRECVGGIDIPNQLPEGAESFSGYWREACIGAAIALGVIPALSPEQPFEPPKLDHNELLDRMDMVAGGPLSWPVGGKTPAVHSRDRWCPYKIFDAVTICVSARRRGFPLTCAGDSLEIGPGVGCVSGMMARLGMVGRCHVIDLPVMAVMQAYLFSTVFGEDKVALSGENYNSAIAVVHGLYRPKVKFDVIVNVNSFPEIPKDKAIEYMDMIASQLQPNGFFLSINHESNRGDQNRVFDLAKKLKLRQRSPWWTRPGYVEEVYTL